MDLKKTLALFNELNSPSTLAILSKASQITVPAKTTLFRQGDLCKNYLLVLDGVIKVFTRAENGREIVLYRLSGGDSCVLTTACLFGNVNYSAEGIAETEVTVLTIPGKLFNEAVQNSEIFRQHVFKSFSSHLSSLIGLVEGVAFGRLDRRLAKYLLEQCDSALTIKITHQNLATELGTAREVISRKLKDLETRGLLEINRGSILITNKDALKEISAL